MDYVVTTFFDHWVIFGGVFTFGGACGVFAMCMVSINRGGL